MRPRGAWWILILAVAPGACGGMPRPAPSDTVALAIEGVTIVDVESGTLHPHATVLVSDGRISLLDFAGAVPLPSGIVILDGRGKFLIPGLWDMHSHSLWSPEAVQTFLPLYTAHGITGIRDMGGRLDILAMVRDSLRRGTPAWPRIVAAGVVLDGPEPVQADISIAVPVAGDAAALVDSLVRSGADFIKVYTLLSREAYFAVLAASRRAGVAVAGHVPGEVTPEEAARAGQKSIEHLRDEIEPFCRRDQLNECATLAALFSAERTWQVPTLVTLRAKAFFDDSALADDPRLGSIPAELRDEWLAHRHSRLRRGEAYLAEKKNRFAEEMWLTGFLAGSGVPILAGSDAGSPFAYPGSGLHDELALLVRAGLSPLDALRAATVAPAEYLGTRDSMGSIAAGQVADLVLLNANPLERIEATREIEMVVLRGRIVHRRVTGSPGQGN